MNYEEYIEGTVAKAVKAFSGHEATLRAGMNGIDVLDFRKPGTGCYSLRVVFDHERGGRVYISGDLGEAVVYPTCDATLCGMAECFTRRDKSGEIRVNWGYFLEKVRASSDRYCWDAEAFAHDFKEHCDEYDLTGAKEFLDENLDVWSSGIDVDCVHGVTLSDGAKLDLEEIDGDYREWVYECGKRVSARVILWLVALRLAHEAVGSESEVQG